MLNNRERILAGIAAALAMALFFVAVGQRDSHDVISKDGQWQYYIRDSHIQDDGVYLSDGSAVTGTVMARWTGTGWEYRKMTLKRPTTFLM